MSVLVVGASHRSASVELLEQLAVAGDSSAKLARAALDTLHVSEALVVATCNRVEIHAEVDRFHGSVEDLTRLLLDNATATSADEVLAALYVHYDEAAVAHVFTVATGLDSMVVGEAQILGQLKAALAQAQTNETVGPTLNTLFQQGIRVGKRAHAETAIDKAGQSLVSVALQEAADVIGPLDGTRVAIVGAGSIAALSAASVRRAHAADIVVLSRSPERARRLAEAVAERWPGCGLDPAAVRTNVVVWRHPDPAAVVDHLESEGVRARTVAPGTLRFVTHHEVDDEGVDRAVKALASAP